MGWFQKRYQKQRIIAGTKEIIKGIAAKFMGL